MQPKMRYANTPLAGEASSPRRGTTVLPRVHRSRRPQTGAGTENTIFPSSSRHYPSPREGLGIKGACETDNSHVFPVSQQRRSPLWPSPPGGLLETRGVLDRGRRGSAHTQEVTGVHTHAPAPYTPGMARDVEKWGKRQKISEKGLVSPCWEPQVVRRRVQPNV